MILTNRISLWSIQLLRELFVRHFRILKAHKRSRNAFRCVRVSFVAFSEGSFRTDISSLLKSRDINVK
jgi:hypothetical protein